ncbi:MAG: CpaF family protein, partial [Planctomycetes bacterium]|nr:CpaF family protein [Planctomycetota bacterium]
MIESMDLSKVAGLSDDQLQREFRALAEQVSATLGEPLADPIRERLATEVLDEVFGLGPLEPLMHDPTITDILVNGSKTVYIERNGKLEVTDVVFADDQHLIQIIQRVVGRVGRRIDEVSPMVDARMPDGSRLNAVIPPLARNGPVLSIRRFVHTRVEFGDTMRNGSITPEIVQFLEAIVRGRLNVLISGGTGAGKTTMLNNLSGFIPTHQRVVTIETTAELVLKQPHVVMLEMRPSNVEGQGEVTQRDLLRNSLRMRPDRIMVGDVLGPEALDMLQAMNTGHDGSISTLHANDTRDALSRLEMMVALSGVELPTQVVRQYIAAALDILVQVARLSGGVRRLMKVSELRGYRDGDYEIHDIFCFRQTGVDSTGAAQGSFWATGYKPNCLARLKTAGFELGPSLFEERELKAGANGT